MLAPSISARPIVFARSTTVMAEYRDALASVADVQSSRDKQQTPAWQRIAATSRLAGEIARAIAEDTAALRQEFRTSA